MHLWNHRQREQIAAVRQWDQRAQSLIPVGTETTTYSTSRLFAAVYPETVSLAEVIASPPWRQLAHGDTAGQHLFLTEACRRLGRGVPDLNNGRADAIRHWMIFDSDRPPGRPDKTFPETREYAATRPAKPNNASLERAQREARWFALNRCGGSSILHHRHIRPVLAREWATEMDGIAATISASSSLFDYGGIRGREYEAQHSENAKSSTRVPEDAVKPSTVSRRRRQRRSEIRGVRQQNETVPPAANDNVDHFASGPIWVVEWQYSQVLTEPPPPCGALLTRSPSERREPSLGL